MRAVFSLLAACYIVAALAFPGFWLAEDLRLPLAAWWPAYLALELVLLGVPICYAVWELVWRPASAIGAMRRSHFARLVTRVLAVVYAFLVVPAGCFISLPHRANVYAGFSALAAAAFATMAYLTYVRRDRAR